MSGEQTRALYWVRGRAAGALYDLGDGRVERVPPEMVALVERALDQRGGSLAAADPTPEEQLWLDLAGLNGATVQPLAAETVMLDDQPRLIWFELTGRCNYTCVHCYAESDPQPRQGELPTSRWLQLLDEAAALGFRQVQLTGGDPAMHPALPELLERAAALPFELVELYTNASLLSDRLVAKLAAHGVHLAASFYSARPEVYDAITGVAGSFERAVRGLVRAMEVGVPLRIGLVEMPQNVASVDETIAFLEDLGVPRRRITRDRVRPAGRGRAIEGCGNGASGFVAIDAVRTSSPPTGFRRPQPLPVAARTDAGRLVWNTCWSGELAIDPTGQVYPCIFARSTPLGSVATQSLQHCLRETAVREAWDRHLGDAEGCRGCEFRFACFDCRALTVNVTGRPDAKPPTCIYEPATGRVDAGKWVRALPIAVWRSSRPVAAAPWRVLDEAQDGPWIESDAGVRARLSWFGASVLDLVDGQRTLAGITQRITDVLPDIGERDVLAALFELEVQGLVQIPDPQPDIAVV